MPAKEPVYILAIESSCDETAGAIISLEKPDRELPGFPKIAALSSVVKSQIKLHSKMGGVVPEAAARAHVKNILPVVKKTIADSRLSLSDIDYIAVTVGPGLIPSLIVGVEFAKALSLATRKPVIPVNHLEGHLYSPFGRINPNGQIPRSRINPKFKSQNQASLFPMVSLIVSGGHTILALMESLKAYRVLGQTVDDAAGEAFDKVAKLLKLPYPGGPEVSRLAEQAKNPANFPRPMLNSKDYNFSFAGLKTAVLYHVQALGPSSRLTLPAKADICAGFQQAAVDVLTAKTLRAVNEFGARSVSLSGGVSANKSLRNSLREICQSNNLRFFAPSFSLSTDNAEMIGMAAGFKHFFGQKPKHYRKIKPDPALGL